MRKVYSLGNEPLWLFQRFRVDKWKVRRIEANVILYKNDGLHSRNARIVVDIQFVFQVLDYRNDNAEVTLPDEDPVEEWSVMMRK